MYTLAVGLWEKDRSLRMEFVELAEVSFMHIIFYCQSLGIIGSEKITKLSTNLMFKMCFILSYIALFGTEIRNLIKVIKYGKIP